MTFQQSPSRRVAFRHPQLLSILLATLLLSAGTTALAQTPSYSGEVCLSGSTATIEVTATPTATAILVYPTPPGGGYFMSNDGTGTYSHSITGLSAGTSLTFHLVIQVPQQYEFSSHTVTLQEGCTSFSFDGGGGGDPDPDPDPEPDPDPDPNGPTPQTPRNFRQSIVADTLPAAFRFETGAPASPLPATVGVTAHYRINGGAFQSTALNGAGGFVWTTNIDDAEFGDVIDYYFTQKVGDQFVDSGWFRQVIGEPAPALPDYPLYVEGSARFRDRHANEWRFDHYVQGYDVGRTFDFIIIDNGDSLDVEVFTRPDVPVNDIDIKWFDQAGPQPFCGRANSAISQRMTATSSSFIATIPNLMYGQTVDIEFTLLAAQTYYSEFFYYAVGSGKLDHQFQHPWAYAAGDASVSRVTIKQFAYNQHALNLSPAELAEFMEGKVLFETNYQDGTLFNPPTAFDCNGGPVGFNMGPSPVHQPGALGPHYNNVSCIQCHMLDGRGRAPSGPSDAIDDLTIRVGIPGADANGAPLPHPYYGSQLAHQATPGVQPEGNPTISYETVNGQFDDGTPYTLRRPIVNFDDMAFGPLGNNVPGTSVANPPVAPYADDATFSTRIAPILAGLGLLEAVDEQTILEYADANDDDQDGISGRPNYVWNTEAQATQLGRFGWKAGQPSLKQQAAIAFLNDMGLTTPVYPTHPCTPVETDCSANADDQSPEINGVALDSIVSYLRGLTVPPRENYTNPDAIWGKQLFEQANCQACHRATLTTGDTYPIAGYRNQAIQPFTDMLLHDMGEGLADNSPEFEADGREWRTPPLWAVGLVGHVLGTPTEAFDPNGNPDEPNYLHDGRARSLMEAILWHGGEAEASRDAVLAMSASERDALIAYVEYPFADPPYVAPIPAIALGDMNCDGVVDTSDIEPFVLALIDAGQYQSQHPTCDISLADCNADTATDGNDVTSFATIISGG